MADNRVYVDHGLTGTNRERLYRAVERERTRHVMGVGITVG